MARSDRGARRRTQRPSNGALGQAAWRAGLLALAGLGAAPGPAAAQQVWQQKPVSGDFNTAANWTPNVVPINAFFQTSNITDLSFSADTTVGGWSFLAGASSYIFTVDRGRTLTFAGVGIDGGGSSPTIINGGRLEFGNSSTAGNASITNNDILVFESRGTAGTATITNNNILRFSENSTAESATITNNGALAFELRGTGGNARLINGPSGIIQLIGIAPVPVTVGSIEGSGAIRLGQRTLVVGDNNRSTRFSGVIQGDGSLIKRGTGDLNLSGQNTYTGVTEVAQGTLTVNGSIPGSVIVEAGAALQGSGTTGSVIMNGRVSPGNSIGTLHVNGDLNMAPDSRYYVEINGQTSDRIEVAGTANIQSSVFEIAHDTNTASAPVVPGKTYTLLTTQGGLTVTSPTLAIADFPFLAFTLSADAFNGYLTTSRSAVSFADLASTPNAKAIANALETTATSSPLWQKVVGASEAQARAAFTSLSNASIHANAAGVLSEQSQYLRDAVTGRMRQDFVYGTPLAQTSNALSYADAPRNAYAADMPFYKAPPPAIVPRPAQVYAVWAQALGSQGTLNGDGNAARTDHSLGGVISGLDVTFNGIWRVGLAGGYSQSTFKSPDIAASGSSDSYHIALYGGGQLGAWGLRGGASYSWNDVRTTRQVAAINFVETERGDYALKTTQAFGEVGYTYAFGVSAIEPFLNIAYVRVDGGVSELGGLAAMAGSVSLDTTYTTLGVRGATALTQTLTARGTLGWRHALGDVTPIAALAFQSGSAFALAGSPIARDALVAEAGLDLAVAPNASVGVSWAGQFADQSHNNMVKGNFSWRF